MQLVAVERPLVVGSVVSADITIVLLSLRGVFKVVLPRDIAFARRAAEESIELNFVKKAILKRVKLRKQHETLRESGATYKELDTKYEFIDSKRFGT